MKKNSILRMLTLIAALLVILTTLMSCDASSAGDMAPGSPTVNNGVGGMEGGSGDGTLAGGQNGEYDRKIIRTVTMSCETKGYDDAVTLIIHKESNFKLSANAVRSAYENGIFNRGIKREQSAESTDIRTHAGRHGPLYMTFHKLNCFITCGNINARCLVTFTETLFHNLLSVYK